MKFCGACGEAVQLQTVLGDSVLRHVCGSCKTIHYVNPKLIVGCLPVYEGSVLLCKRAIEPALGLWTLPSGFMEIGESVEQGALRETWEEAHAEVEIVRLFSEYSLPHIGQVYLLFLARLKNLNFSAGQETLETRLYSKEEVPWDQIAFSAVRFALEKYFSDPSTITTHLGTFSK